MPRAAHYGLVEEQGGSSRLMRSTTGLKTFINHRTGQLSPLTASMTLNEVTKTLSGPMPHNPR